MRGTVERLGIPEEAEDVLRFWFPEHLRDDQPVRMVVSRRRRLCDHRALSAPVGASCARRTGSLVAYATIAARADHRPRSVLPPSIAVRRGRTRRIRRRLLWRSRESSSVTTPPSTRRGRKRSSSCRWATPRSSRIWNSGQARRGTGRTGAGRATQGPRALGGAGPWPSRRHRALRAPSSSERSPGPAIHPGGTGLPGRRAARPHATAALRGRCSLAAVAGYSAAAA
jgi:hypothetical protein